jgi:hypothetical protein
MNVGHAGFEFYDVAPEGQLAPIGRPLQSDWEAQGKVPDMPGYAFRARRMIRGMGHMLFPRYIQREARDFFYLTSRSILPGAPLPPAIGAPTDPGEGQWRTRGLPQHGFPFAIATTWIRMRGGDVSDALPGSVGVATNGDTRMRVIRVDPRASRPIAPEAPAGDDPTVLTLVAPGAAARAARTLWWHEGLFAIDRTAPAPSATPLLGGCAMTEPCASSAHAAIGVQNEDGMLVWVELPPAMAADGATASSMDALLARMGCSARMAVPGRAQALLGGALDAIGAPVATPAPATVRLVRASAPDARPIFTDTPIVPIEVWQPLQKKRVRYFYKPAATASP